MTTLREAAKQALEALEQYTNVVTSVNDPNSWVSVSDGGKPARDAITALRAAIEQAQEPVAWISESENLLSWDKFYDHMTPLYTVPPQRTWVGLTDKEIVAIELNPRQYYDGKSLRFDLSLADFARAIEAKLKEKNT